MNTLERIKQAVPILEISTLVFAAWSLLYRSTLYWTLPIDQGSRHGLGDTLDLLFALLLFIICFLCAASGVALSLMGGPGEKRLAYRPFLVGVLSFLVYDIVHPHMPKLL